MPREINNYNKIVLDNGLTLILYQIKEVQSVFITCSIKSGNDYAEDVSEIGLAHFLEHLSFSSTEKYKTRKDLTQAIDDVGAYVNASTNIQRTNYWIKAPSVNTLRSISILYQMIFKSVITDEEIEKEKKIVLNEYRDSQISDTAIFKQKIQENKFTNLPQYQSLTMGEPNKIKSFTKNMVFSWKNKFYNSNNLILSIVGNFDEEKVLSQVKNTFGKEKKGEKYDFPRRELDKYSNHSVYIQKNNSNQIWFDINWPVFGWRGVTRHEEMVLKVLNNYLGRGPGSKLNLELRESKSLTYGSGSYISMFPYLGSLGICGTVEKRNLEFTLGEIEKIIKSLKDGEMSKHELEKTKKAMKLHDYLNFESPESISWYLVNELFDYGEIWSTENYAKEVEKVTVSEIKKLSKRIFIQNKMNMNLLGNTKGVCPRNSSEWLYNPS